MIFFCENRGISAVFCPPATAAGVRDCLFVRPQPDTMYADQAEIWTYGGMLKISRIGEGMGCGYPAGFAVTRRCLRFLFIKLIFYGLITCINKAFLDIRLRPRCAIAPLTLYTSLT